VDVFTLPSLFPFFSRGHRSVIFLLGTRVPLGLEPLKIWARNSLFGPSHLLLCFFSVLFADECDGYCFFFLLSVNWWIWHCLVDDDREVAFPFVFLCAAGNFASAFPPIPRAPMPRGIYPPPPFQFGTLNTKGGLYYPSVTC